MKTTQQIYMDTKITDIALLGTASVAGFSNLIDHYGGFIVTFGGALLFGIIRWQQHKQMMKNLKLDEELKKQQLNANRRPKNDQNAVEVN